MKTRTLDAHHSPIRLSFPIKLAVVGQIKKWIKEQEPLWEHNRLGIAATGIFIQVTFAGGMMGILSMAGASPFIYTGAIFFSFMSNSFAFAQLPMRKVLGLMLLSIVLDAFLMIFYGIRLIG